MNAPSRVGMKIAGVCVILALILAPLADLSAVIAGPLLAPSKCSASPLVLLNTVDADISIENPTFTNISYNGCDVSGQMRIQIAGVTVGSINVQGRVDNNNAFTSTSIAPFNLPLAGLTLKVLNSSFVAEKLLFTSSKIKIPDSWGGLEATVPKTFTLDSQGLKVYTFTLPAINTKKLTLELWADLALASGYYKIVAHGALMLPDIGKTEECFIKADVTLYVNALGNTVMEIDTPGSKEVASLAADRSEIALPAGKARLAPASMPLQSSYLAVPDSLPADTWAQLWPEDYQVEYDAPDGGDALEPEMETASLGDYQLTSMETAANPSPLYPDAVPTDWGGLDITAGWECQGKGIPLGTTGFELTGVTGQLTLLPSQESIRLTVTLSSVAQLASTSILGIEGGVMFQWSPEFAASITGQVSVLEMFTVSEFVVSFSESDGFRLIAMWRSVLIRADVSLHAWLTHHDRCTTWSTTCYDHYPLPPTCASACSAYDTVTKFHLTGSAACEVGMGKGELVNMGGIPYPCGCKWCKKWFIYYPCCKWCTVDIALPPFNMFLAGAGAQFGEFTGNRWGLKGTVHFLDFSTGFYVDHKGKIDFGDVSSYKLVDSVHLQKARDTWKAAALKGEAAMPYTVDDTFTFTADDRVLVHFNLPLGEAYQLPIKATSAITQAQVISQTDTIFSVKSDVPLNVSLISPSGVEINPSNYASLPDYSVEYSHTYGFEQINKIASNQTRWRFIHASDLYGYEDVNVYLDGSLAFSSVYGFDNQVLGYVELEPGIHQVDIVPNRHDFNPLSKTFEASEGKSYSILLTGREYVNVVVFDDDNSEPGSGFGRVRLANLASSYDTIDALVYSSTGDTHLIKGVPFHTASNYLLLPSGTYSLTVNSPGIDPIQAAMYTDPSATGMFGSKVSSAGDVNGDGYADILVANNSDNSNRGKVSLYLGSPQGQSTTPAWTATGENPGDQFGISIAGAGDVNGDGYDDIVVGAFGYSSSRGKVYVFLGSTIGVSSSPVWTMTGENASDRYGGAVAGVGDVDGDGYDDLLVGAPGYSDYRGKVYLYYGPLESSEARWTAEGENWYDNYGSSIASAGDVNGDGYSDFIVGAYKYPSGDGDRGAAYLYQGDPTQVAAHTAWTAYGANWGYEFGISVAGAGDVNGDGYDDVLVGAAGYPDYESYQGSVYLYLGSIQGLISPPAWIVVGEARDNWFGASVAGAGDVNGDGYADFIIGAPGYSSYYWSSIGNVYLYYGSSSLDLDPPWSAIGVENSDRFGLSVAGAGDVNGDGYDDFLAGSPGGTPQAYLYYVSLGVRPTHVTLSDGDVQTFFIKEPYYPDPLALLQSLDQSYGPFTEWITTTLYVVDQADPGDWSIVLDGSTDGAHLQVSAVAAPNPPILDQLTVDASDLSKTLVSYRLLSNYRPVVIQIFANDGPMTGTMTIPLPPDSSSMVEPKSEAVTLFQGFEVARLEIKDEMAVAGSLITNTVDLSVLESGNYKLWVRAEDGVSPPVQGYVWGADTYQSAKLPAGWNTVSIAKAGYDSAKQMAGAATITVDHSATFTGSWDPSLSVEILPEGLYIEFTPFDHPDVDAYDLEVEVGGAIHTMTTGKLVKYQYDPNAPSGSTMVHYATFAGISPKHAYTLRVGARDLDRDQVLWSTPHTYLIPLGEFTLTPQSPVIELQTVQSVVTATLLLNMSENLFSDVHLVLDSFYLPPGFSLRGITYQPLPGIKPLVSVPEWESIPAPARLVAPLFDQTPGAGATLLVHAAINLPANLPAASYTLPFIGYSGELEKRTEVKLLVGASQEFIIQAYAASPTVFQGNLPLVSCATGLLVNIPANAFDVQTRVSFRQASSNIADWKGIRFGGSAFSLTAVNASTGLPVTPLVPLVIDLVYSPVCVGEIAERGLHLRLASADGQWMASPVCTTHPVNDRLSCSLPKLGDFALFKPAALYLPLMQMNR